MEKFTIADAFRAFDLEEENDKDEELSKSFKLGDSKDVVKAAKFITKEVPEETTEMIIDVDAEEPEDLKKSYVGELVLQCPVCNALISKKETDVHCDEEDETICNVGEECPTCHSDSGFTLVGKLAPFKETTDVTVDETEDTDGIEKSLDIDKEVKVEDDFDLEDAFDVEDESLNEDTVKQGNKWVNKGKEGTHGTFKTKKAAGAQRKAMFASGYKGESLTESQSQEIASYWNDIDEENNAPISDFAEIFIKETPDLKSKGKMDILFNREDWARFEKWLKDTKGVELKKPEEPAMNDVLEEAPILEPKYDLRKSFYNKAETREENGETILSSYGVDVAKIKDGKATLLPKWDFSQTTVRHVKEFLRQNGFKADGRVQIAKDYVVEPLAEDLKVEVSPEGKEVKVETDTKEVKVEEHEDGAVEVKVEEPCCETEVVDVPVEPVVVDTEIEAPVEVEDEFVIDESTYEPLVNKFLVETY